jgi:hypothetical protein
MYRGVRNADIARFWAGRDIPHFADRESAYVARVSREYLECCDGADDEKRIALTSTETLDRSLLRY